MPLVNALPFRWRDVEGRWAQVQLHLHASLQVWIKGGALKVEPKRTDCLVCVLAAAEPVRAVRAP